MGAKANGDIPIEKGVSTLEAKSTRRRNYAFDRMAVGDSIFIPYPQTNSATSSARN